MTREEAIKVLLDEWKCIDRNDGINCDRKCEKCDLVMDSAILKEAYNMAIKALEQEPCEDAVSRQAVLDSLHSKFADGFDSDRWWNSMSVLYAINKVPSVRPQEQTGHWEKIVKEHKCYARDDTYTTTEYHCSECGAEPFENEDGFYELSNYCPSCGAKMFEPQESEVNNG